MWWLCVWVVGVCVLCVCESVNFTSRIEKYGSAGQHGQVESLTWVTHLLNDDAGVMS